ncbi:hypothetical protein CHS0354_007393 [Potamilus streckersoni]|uniref:Uncharacterized protein n=1 Tax=Potamilus streckersoni TaxID=2493646 RepID=A0AAE0SRH0_9BIVA|nr:hypothetical protein CHS0354_007393 [Potamilus streckersoni]
MAQNFALRTICQTSRCLSKRNVFSPVIYKSKISLSASCPVPHSKDGGDGVPDDSKTWNENKKTSVDLEKIPELKEKTPFSHSRGPSFLDNHMKMRPLSPMKRFANILSQEYTNSLDGSQNDKGHISDKKSSNYCDAESSKTGFDSKESQAPFVAVRSKSILPSQRLSKMIPSVYWEEVDKDTKRIIQNIEGDCFGDKGKSKKNVPES